LLLISLNIGAALRAAGSYLAHLFKPYATHVCLASLQWSMADSSFAARSMSHHDGRSVNPGGKRFVEDLAAAVPQ
jgi:hypothetical protein